jgi:hypothetical protein
MRKWLEVGRSQSPHRGTPKLAVNTHAPRDAVEALHYKTRRALATATIVAGTVALAHQPLAAALAASHVAGALGAAHEVLTWPVPLTQPVLAGVGAAVLSIIGVQSRGWRQVTRRQCWFLLASTVIAVLGAAPMILVCVLTVAVIALAIMSALLIFFGLLVLLLVGRRR